MEGRWTVGVDYVIEDRGHETPCWIWQHYTTKKGHGQARCEGKSMHAHRIAFQDAFGWLPSRGFEIHHKCEVPACINPGHLISLSKGAHMDEHGRRKLDPEKAAIIRERRAAGESYYRLALDFGVSMGAILNVVRGKSHAPEAVLRAAGEPE
jgi:hypothetical protein